MIQNLVEKDDKVCNKGEKLSITMNSLSLNLKL